MKSLFIALLPSALAVSACDVPNLKMAAPIKSKIVLVASHPTAKQFAVRIKWQDEGMSFPSEVFLRCPEWHKDGTSWTTKIKFSGDTNWVSVAVCGTTNWSNTVVSIP